MDRIEIIAAKLAEDWLARAPYTRLTGEMAPADMAEAYAIQQALHRRLAKRRGAIAGRKIALSSRAMQEMVGIDSPIGGAIFADDVLTSPARVRSGSFRHLGLEYELAVTLGKAVAPGDGPFDAGNVFGLIASVCPAFELIEDRGADYSDLCPLTLIADNAWCGGIVLGDKIRDWRNLDLGDLPVVLHQRDVAPEHGNTGAADPLGSLAWVLNHVTGQGETMEAGQIVITGSVLRTRFPNPGDRLHYQISDLAAAEIHVL